MPTISQLVKRKRKDKTKKSNSPVLQYTKNSIKRGKMVELPKGCPQKR
jgi:ribosomal protein S12